MSHSSSYKVYRNTLHSECMPCLPYIGVYLTDLTFIEDGNPDLVAGNLINFQVRKEQCKNCSSLTELCVSVVRIESKRNIES